MKTCSTLAMVCLIGFSAICQAQTDPKKPKTDPVKQMNLLDEQTKMYGQFFELAGAREENPTGGANTYLEAIEEMDAPEDLKETLREQYKVYDLSLDPTKTDSLELMIGKMLENAIEKTQSDIDN